MRLLSAFFVTLASSSVLPPVPRSQSGTSRFPSPTNKWTAIAKWNPNSRHNGPLTLYHALSKYQIPIPKNLQRACDDLISHASKRKAKRQNGSAPAHYRKDDMQFVVPVKIGDRNNPQTVNLDFDTGSADLWVFSDRLPMSQQQSGHSIFKSKLSESIKLDPTLKWKITYGDRSSASGSVGFDTVSVGETTVKNQAIELAEHISSQFQQDKSSDGLLGLAFGHINTITPTQQKTFFENAMDSLDAKIFTADLKHEQDGSYDFGFLDESKYTGEIEYVPVDKTNGFWEFESNAFSLDGGHTINHARATAIADTGTSLLIVSEKVAQAYYDIFPEAIFDSIHGGYTFPCDSHPPPFTVYVGNHPVMIRSHLLIYAPLEEGSDTCFGGLQSIPEGRVGGVGAPTMYIFGGVFLKACFAVFDYGTDGSDARFGFAAKATTGGLIDFSSNEDKPWENEVENERPWGLDQFGHPKRRNWQTIR